MDCLNSIALAYTAAITVIILLGIVSDKINSKNSSGRKR